MTENWITSNTLLERAKTGDDSAWDQLFKVYQPFLERYCLRKGVAASDVDDLIHETYQAVLKNLKSFKRKRLGSFRAFLKQITHNKICDSLRARTRNPTADSRIVEAAFRETREEQQEEEKQIFESMVLYLKKNCRNDNHWQAFSCTVLEKKTSAECARELSTTDTQIRSWKARFIDFFKKQFADSEEFIATVLGDESL